MWVKKEFVLLTAEHRLPYCHGLKESDSPLQRAKCDNLWPLTGHYLWCQVVGGSEWSQECVQGAIINQVCTYGLQQSGFVDCCCYCLVSVCLQQWLVCMYRWYVAPLSRLMFLPMITSWLTTGLQRWFSGNTFLQCVQFSCFKLHARPFSAAVCRFVTLTILISFQYLVYLIKH